MKLYFSPLACSLASRIALYESGIEASYVEVDLRQRRTADGQSYLELHPLGLVPLLELEGGERLSENVAILSYIAERGERGSANDALRRARLNEALGFISTELHKALYTPLLDENASAEAKAYALSKAESRLAELERRLSGREFVLAQFSVADAYLFAILNWSRVTPVDLGPWPSLRAYQAKLLQRPAFARAFGEERALYFERSAERRAPASGNSAGAPRAGHPATRVDPDCTA